MFILSVLSLDSKIHAMRHLPFHARLYVWERAPRYIIRDRVRLYGQVVLSWRARLTLSHRTPSPWGWTATGSYRLSVTNITGQPLSWAAPGRRLTLVN